jgi:hypothetical protein
MDKLDIINKIKWMCFDIYITIDFQALNLDFQPRKEILNGGSYGFRVDGKFRTKNGFVKIV